MNENILRENLIDALTGENAHLSIEAALKNLKPENRNVNPSPGIHSVWELLEHIRITQEDMVQYVLDPEWVSPSWPDEYWPREKGNVPDDEWNNSILNYKKDLQNLVKIIEDKNIDLTSVIPHTKKHTYLREILLVIDHNSYHTAQIIQTRKAVGDWRE